MPVSSAYPTLDSKHTAAAIRKVLKAQFPATKFSVVTERGSMVSSVRIAWTDGPTKSLVESLVGGFEAGRFDGMTDSYDYDRDAAIVLDGQVFRPGCKYLFCERTISIQLAAKAAQQVAEYFGLRLPAILNKGSWWEVDPGAVHEPSLATGDDWNMLIHQACEDRSRFTPTTV